MSEAPYRAIGGMVVADHGPIALRQARDLAASYARDANGGGGWSARCAARAEALAMAINDASNWRRAAGWADPDEADRRKSSGL
ncbi:MAG: hypothetical protein ACREEB_01510 [Caulobacteraceae bacterium]